MTTKLLQLAVAVLLALTLAYMLFLSMTALGREIGPFETLVLWILTALTAWLTFRSWARVRRT
jgi:hypothetical protein